MKRKIIVALVALMAMLGLVLAGNPSPAHASVSGGGITAQFKTSGWWYQADTTGQYQPAEGYTDNAYGLTTANVTKYQYPNFPIACNTTPSDDAWQVLWIVHPGDTVSIPTAAYKAVNMAASIFSASAHRVLSDEATYRASSLAPRFVTNSNCGVTFNVVTVPASMVGPADGVDIANYIKNTYGASSIAPNRKYLALFQSSTPGSASGISFFYSTGYINPNNYNASVAGTNNNANTSGFSFVSSLSGWDSYGGQTIAHEMAHNMNPVNFTTGTTPHSTSSGHVSDANDILNAGYASGCEQCGTQYQVNYTYNNGCGEQANTSAPPSNTLLMDVNRLDCNFDDYFNPYTSGCAGCQTWQNTRWGASKSSFLWGNPQPAANAFPASPCNTAYCKSAPAKKGYVLAPKARGVVIDYDPYRPTKK